MTYTNKECPQCHGSALFAHCATCSSPTTRMEARLFAYRIIRERQSKSAAQPKKNEGDCQPTDWKESDRGGSGV